MKFHEYFSIFDRKKGLGELPRKTNAGEWYDSNMDSLGFFSGDKIAFAAEGLWYSLGRPYFSVWPLASESFQGIRLNGVSLNSMRLPLGSMLIRFPIGNEPVVASSYAIRSFLLEVVNDPYSQSRRYLGASMEWHESSISSITKWSMVNEFSENQEMESFIHNLDESQFPNRDEVFRFVIRHALAISLLANDPDLIEPDVLDRDREKWDRTHDSAIVERAHRRGKKGWVIGRHMDVSPHYRRAHFGLRWTGQGHAIPKIVPVKGAIVRRKKLSEVPTGYLDKEQQQDG